LRSELTLLCAVFVVACADPPGGEPPLPEIPAADARPDLEVTVLNASDGTPVSEIWAVLTPGSRDQPSDASGVARFVGVRPDTYEVVVDGPGFARASASVVVEDDDAAITVEVTPEDVATGSLRGRVTDALGDELARVPVRLGELEALTNDEGRYVFDAVDPGVYTLSVEPTPGVAGSWSSGGVEIVGGGELVIDVALSGTAPAGAFPIGSASCAFCHEEQASSWSQTAHARALRTPAELQSEAHPIAVDFASTMSVDLSPDLGEARLRDVAGQWFVDVDDALGVPLGSWAVEDVYGGHNHSAAFVGREGGGERTLLPIVWNAEGRGVLQPGGFDAAFTDRWIDGGTGQAGPVRGEASFDLACGGCHTTGGELVESAAGYELGSFDGRRFETGVGCEACHGYGSGHLMDASERALNIVNPARMQGSRQVEVCARCHGRYETDDHPFTDDPGWPATAEGRLVPPDRLRQLATPDRDTFVAVPASRTFGDQAGDLFASPHQGGASGYLGTCSDCHLPHGSPHPANLKTDPFDPTLCTSCHLDFVDVEVQREHSGHSTIDPGQWTAGACVGCHVPRLGALARRDPLSGVGDSHAHTIAVWHPEDIVAEFDAAGVDVLPPEDVPVSACYDCHLQARELLDQQGQPFTGPVGNPFLRVTYDNLAALFDFIWGAE